MPAHLGNVLGSVPGSALAACQALSERIAIVTAILKLIVPLRRWLESASVLLQEVGVTVHQFPGAILVSEDLRRTQHHRYRPVLSVDKHLCTVQASPKTEIARRPCLDDLEPAAAAFAEPLGTLSVCLRHRFSACHDDPEGGMKLAGSVREVIAASGATLPRTYAAEACSRVFRNSAKS